MATRRSADLDRYSFQKRRMSARHHSPATTLSCARRTCTQILRLASSTHSRSMSPSFQKLKNL